MILSLIDNDTYHAENIGTDKKKIYLQFLQHNYTEVLERVNEGD